MLTIFSITLGIILHLLDYEQTGYANIVIFRTVWRLVISRINDIYDAYDYFVIKVMSPHDFYMMLQIEIKLSTYTSFIYFQWYQSCLMCSINNSVITNSLISFHTLQDTLHNSLPRHQNSEYYTIFVKSYIKWYDVKIA